MHQIAPNFADSTRVWIYQSNRPFSDTEADIIGQQLRHFANSWAAHGASLAAFGEVYANQFIILGVDESRAGASGCSIDKSTHFIEALERAHHIDLFDRMTFAWLDENTEVKTATASVFAELYKKGTLTPETMVFDNLVPTLGDLRKNWQKPITQSWHKRFV